MADTFGQERGGFLNVEGTFFTNTKDYRDRPQMLAVEELLGGGRKVVFGSLWDLGIHIRRHSTGTTALPLFFAVLRIEVHSID